MYWKPGHIEAGGRMAMKGELRSQLMALEEALMAWCRCPEFRNNVAMQTPYSSEHLALCGAFVSLERSWGSLGPMVLSGIPGHLTKEEAGPWKRL